MSVQTSAVISFVLSSPSWLRRSGVAISSIDISRMASSDQLVIRTDRGCSIIWGSSPEASIDASEVTIRQKLDFLNYFDRQFGRIDAKCSPQPGGTGRIDLRIDYALWMAIDGPKNPSTSR